MPEKTDMILEISDLVVVPDGPAVELIEVGPNNLPEVLDLVASGQQSFLQYYESPSPGAVVCGVYETGDLIGAVMLQLESEARESSADAALAALVIAEEHRGRGLATATIGAAARMLGTAGFRRVIAEWVWSKRAYERVGFTAWRTRFDPR
jgi:GNAT superfamily N-acetyltransferase